MAKVTALKIYSYVVDHDDGKEPNPFGGTCTLCRCKYGVTREQTQGRFGRKNVVELAAKKRLTGEEVWVIGTGGTGKRSTGNGTLIYAMKVDQALTREEFCSKHPKKKSEPPENDFEKHEQFALTSRHFWYFGSNAKRIPEEFKSEKPNGFKLEKKGRGFRCIDPEDFGQFYEWLKKNYESGKQGEPCGRAVDQPRGCKPCKSSCSG